MREIIFKIKRKIKDNRENDFLENIYKDYKEFTMIPKQGYISNLKIVKDLVKPISGDIIECGVWRGGMSAGIAKILGANRTYYLFDSFEGLPDAKEIDGANAIDWQKNVNSLEYYENCKAEITYAKSIMEKTGCRFDLIKGWFSETLPGFFPNKPIALLRLDADWYDSTMECLNYLYPKVLENGIIIIDDYYSWDGCSKAVHDYLSSIKSSSKIYTSKGGISYIIKKEAN